MNKEFDKCIRVHTNLAKAWQNIAKLYSDFIDEKGMRVTFISWCKDKEKEKDYEKKYGCRVRLE